MFETNGGSVIEMNTHYTDSYVSAPVSPVKDGYSFIGWYYDEDLTSPVTWPITLDQDYTLYAKWEAVVNQNVRLTFETNGGSLPYGGYPVQVGVNHPVNMIEESEKRRLFIFWLVL